MKLTLKLMRVFFYLFVSVLFSSRLPFQCHLHKRLFLKQKNTLGKWH